MEQDVTGAAIFLIMAASLVVFLLEMMIHVHWPLYFLTTFLMLSVPFFGIDPGAGAVFLFFTFQITFWVMNGLTKEKKERLIPEHKKQTGSRRKAAAVLMLFLVFVISISAVSRNTEWFYQTVYNAEGYLHRTIKRSGRMSDSPSDGTVSRSNLYPAGMLQMEVLTDTQPSETIYLKGFTGGSYSHGEWQPANDEVIFERMENNTLHWERWSSWIPGPYETLYFVMNAGTIRTEPLSERMLWIQYEEGAEEQWYAPYFSMWILGNISQIEGTGNEYEYIYYEMNEIDIDWDNVPRGFELNRDWYYETQQAYQKEIILDYTEVPAEELSRLAGLCEENPADSLEEITGFIMSVLHNSAVYTRTPGLFPVNEDPVEYFLFEGREGYCQHFASAAVLMYRLYGIPARYAAGYAVSPSSFVRQPDGFYLAEVSDESAHAWPEIFVEDYGWIPIEVTPSADSPVPDYPNMDSGRLADLLSSDSWNLESLRQSGTETGTGTAHENTDRDFGFSITESIPAGSLPECMAYILLIAAAVFALYRLLRLIAADMMEVRERFGRVMEAVHFAGFLKEYDGSEPDFAMRLSREVPEVTNKQIKRFCFLAQAAAFGDKPAGPLKESEAARLYRELIRAVYQRLPLRKKLIFKYIKTYL